MRVGLSTNAGSKSTLLPIGVDRRPSTDAASVPSVPLWFEDFETQRHSEKREGECAERFQKFTLFRDSDIAALICPRTLQIQVGSKD